MTSAAASGAETMVDPILTRPATTARSISVIANVKYFENVTLQEADRFDGYGLDFEVAVPLNASMQLRFVLPAYTYGRARLIDPPTYQRIHIKGPGGTFDYPTVLLDHQIRREADAGYNFAYFAGFGMVFSSWGELDTTHGDLYSHQGMLYRLGVKADGAFHEGRGRWLANAGIRRYASDDINPAKTGDNFTHLELMGAALFDRRSDRFTPGVELTYVGDLSRYHALHLVPQMIFPLDNKVVLKVGVPIGLTGDGERWGLRLQMSY